MTTMANRVFVAATAIAAVVGLSVPAFAATTGTPAPATTASVPSGGGSTGGTGGTGGGGGTTGGSKAPTTWYVAQNDKTMACIVTPTKPNGTTYTMIGQMGYGTVKDATAAMRAATECKTVT